VILRFIEPAVASKGVAQELVAERNLKLRSRIFLDDPTQQLTRDGSDGGVEGLPEGDGFDAQVLGSVVNSRPGEPTLELLGLLTAPIARSVPILNHAPSVTAPGSSPTVFASEFVPIRPKRIVSWGSSPIAGGSRTRARFRRRRVSGGAPHRRAIRVCTYR
jgi:hypothetical protein